MEDSSKSFKQMSNMLKWNKPWLKAQPALVRGRGGKQIHMSKAHHVIQLCAFCTPVAGHRWLQCLTPSWDILLMDSSAFGTCFVKRGPIKNSQFTWTHGNHYQIISSLPKILLGAQCRAFLGLVTNGFKRLDLQCWPLPVFQASPASPFFLSQSWRPPRNRSCDVA